MNQNEYIQLLQNDCCILNNLMDRLRCVKEIELIPEELKIVMRFSNLFDQLHIKVEGNILKFGYFDVAKVNFKKRRKNARRTSSKRNCKN